MPTLSSIPYWYWFGAIILSLYHAYRGFHVNWVARVRENENIKYRKWEDWEIISVFSFPDFHFICSLAGFITLVVAKSFYESLDSTGSFDTGKSVLLVFAFLFETIGVTGQLPSLIQQGKFPKKGQRLSQPPLALPWLSGYFRARCGQGLHRELPHP